VGSRDPMREDVVWSDGEPFTAADYAFTAQTVKDLNLISGNWSNWYDFNYLDRIEAPDDFTVRLVFHTKPGLARYEYGVLGAPILAEHYWGPVVEEARAGLDALGASPSDEDLIAAQSQAQDVLFAHDATDEPNAGPFLLANWEPGASLEVVANPDYFASGVTVEQWADAAYRDSEGTVIGEPSGEPETVYTVGPFVEAVVYSIYGSQDTAILALRQGDVDFVLNSLGLQRGLADQIRADPNLTVLENPTNGFRYLSFNNRRMPMNDCSFRQAVAVLIDKEFVTNRPSCRVWPSRCMLSFLKPTQPGSRTRLPSLALDFLAPSAQTWLWRSFKTPATPGKVTRYRPGMRRTAR
jgi:peptide/nickel transport system substrate-binding protein